MPAQGPDDVTVRLLAAEDRTVLVEATLVNVNWAGPRFVAADVEADPRLAHYTLLVRQRGDFGFVAERDGRWVGVVWLLFLPPEDPGYGFVATGVPELSVCVRDGHRRRGLGRSLVRRALAEATDRRVPAVSLSVEAGNGARALYESFGFRDVPDAAHAGTMIVTR